MLSRPRPFIAVRASRSLLLRGPNATASWKRVTQPSPKVGPNDGCAWARFSSPSQQTPSSIRFLHKREMLCGVPDRLPSRGCLRIFQPDTVPPPCRSQDRLPQRCCGLADSDTPCALPDRNASLLTSCLSSAHCLFHLSSPPPYPLT